MTKIKTKILELMESYVSDDIGHTDECIYKDALPDLANDVVSLLGIYGVINWVAIEEKLPSTEGNFYLAWYDNCCISKAAWHGGSFTAVEQGWEDETPTHWAELPKPPCL